MVRPSQKKLAVAHVMQQRLCSVRRACTYLNLPRSTYRYVSKPLTDRQEQLYQRIIALSWHLPLLDEAVGENQSARAGEAIEDDVACLMCVRK